MFSSSCVTLMLLLSIRVSGADGGGATHRRSSLVPSCNSMLEKLSEGHISALRDAAQLQGQHVRISTNWQQYLNFKRNPSTDIGKQYAYNTSKTAEELQKLAEAAAEAARTIENKMSEMIDIFKREGTLPSTANVRNIKGCVYARLNTQMFEHRPKVSLLMQYFKRPQMIYSYIDQMRKCNETVALELLVNVDHPRDHEPWAMASYNSSGMVVPVFSNNIHEVRSYNRLAHMARGDYLILVADDDIPPEDCGWISRVVSILDKWPSVGILGIRNFVTCFNLDAGNRGEYFKDPVLDLTMHFVEKVDMAPMVVRKSAFINIGGMDETTTEPGECGILTDWDLCIRMWVAGWQVMAAKQVIMGHDQEAGGTHKPETAERCWGKQQGITGKVMETHISHELEKEICEVARELTLKNLKQLDPNKCPYPNGCSLST
ncbi:hypothetical protein CEUSTIGMA_g6043.t1 [Chlamydomonas eustigma]|uniref:Glycosyltransferase 2-like domain-containing protein n=1 Tax=Chlamydomonas eustigma TaxID=1157962 RepID=A0A250X696_9CHLO|nr:hypothetical protein CEUSTIGMA_g6043.t1 [Chlamydomonas eustigma]|eukprot:GAX78604.1 hypothetical protein CEUSTIGMA_g6043.t1 [Chlamydomonas eustigma]